MPCVNSSICQFKTNVETPLKRAACKCASYQPVLFRAWDVCSGKVIIEWCDTREIHCCTQNFTVFKRNDYVWPVGRFSDRGCQGHEIHLQPSVANLPCGVTTLSVSVYILKLVLSNFGNNYILYRKRFSCTELYHYTSNHIELTP